MKILVAHNRYQISGGEDSVLASETHLMRGKGCEVTNYSLNNDHINSKFEKLKTAIEVIFSFRQFYTITNQLKDKKPDIVHVHNYFPLISPVVMKGAYFSLSHI